MSLCVILLREQSELWFFTPRMTKMLGGLSPLVVKFGGAAAPRAPLLPTPVSSIIICIAAAVTYFVGYKKFKRSRYECMILC